MNIEPISASEFTQPVFIDQSKTLVSIVRQFSPSDLMKFMKISEKLAEHNYQRFKDWTLPFSLKNAKQAAFTFTGEVYTGLNAAHLNESDLAFAQDHLRILSGLYGLLKPLDLIQPYRLEMGKPLQTHNAKNLYEFWKPIITEQLNSTPGKALINLASNEYFKAIDKRALDKEIITPVFKDEKNGTFKIISFFAKKARGTMARYIIKNRISKTDDLLNFKEDGYAYNPELSLPSEPVFTRSEVKA